ncbi:hypothetical protein ACSS6W_005494 [Trichoderma asperelloides]
MTADQPEFGKSNGEWRFTVLLAGLNRDQRDLFLFCFQSGLETNGQLTSSHANGTFGG